MIGRGHVPTYRGKINSDAAAFLTYFRPKGTQLTVPIANQVARSLHLAFKNMDSGEIYDVLMEQFLAAVAKYDPNYTGKVKKVVECIDHELSKDTQIRISDVNRHLEFDSDRYIRLLTRRGFLTPVKGEDGKTEWKRSEQWPPPAEFFNSGAIGLAYYLQTWFRYYFKIAWKVTTNNYQPHTIKTVSYIPKSRRTYANHYGNQRYTYAFRYHPPAPCVLGPETGTDRGSTSRRPGMRWAVGAREATNRTR
jgi:hypothetical protein